MGPTVTRPAQDPLTVLLLYNRLNVTRFHYETLILQCGASWCSGLMCYFVCHSAKGSRIESAWRQKKLIFVSNKLTVKPWILLLVYNNRTKHSWWQIFGKIWNAKICCVHNQNPPNVVFKNEPKNSSSVFFSKEMNMWLLVKDLKISNFWDQSKQLDTKTLWKS